MLTEKDYCDYETCVALKELGFNQYISIRYYAGEGGVRLWDFDGEPNYKEGEMIALSDMYDVPRDGNEVAAPSLYEAQKWMREEKDIHIEIYACAGGYIYELCKAYKPNSFSGGTTIYTPNDVDNPKLNDAGRYDDFETCLFEGIKEAVKILKYGIGE
jgi:hypothetical protein